MAGRLTLAGAVVELGGARMSDSANCHFETFTFARSPAAVRSKKGLKTGPKMVEIKEEKI